MTRMPIRMPKMSMTMTEGEVSEWHVAVGDEVAVGDVVAEVLTDKIDMEVESTAAGTLVEIVHASGIVAVGEPIGWIEGEDDGSSSFGDLLAEPAEEPAPERAPTQASQTSQEAPPAPPAGPSRADGPAAAVPRARGLARELGVDLATVTGTGPEGLILVTDVEAAATPTAPATPPTAPAAAAATGGDKRRAAIRRMVARTMEPSALIPQFTVWRELELDAADVSRRGLSWTTILLRAYAAALREVPELLSRWENDTAQESGPPSIALAVATDRGLMVPTFAEPDKGPAADLDQEIREVVRAVQTGKLAPMYMGIANGSLSNLGGMGVDRFQALLTPPQASVLSLGSVKQRPVAVPGGVGIALTVNAGLTVDHRVADGVHAAELLDRMAKRLGGQP